MTTNNHTADLLKAIQDLTKQVQTLSYGNRGNRNNNGPRFTNQQTSGQTSQSSNRPNQYVCYACGEHGHVVRTCPNKNNNSSHSPVAGSIGATRRWGESTFKLRGVPHEGECTRQTTIPSNLTLLEAYPATRTTRSKARLDPTAGIVRDKPTEEETILRTVQGSSKVKQPTRTTEAKKVEPKKIIKKKPAAVAPIYKMVEPYTPQQFFDQKADITNGQLLAMNPKFGLTIAKQLRKPVVRAKDNEKNSIKKNDEVPDDKNTPEVDDLIQVANTAGPNADRTSALYCEASIKHIKFPLIVDSGSAGSIISLSLLKDLDMEITKASKTVMVNVNGERRRPLGAVTDIPLRIHDCIIPMDAIVTDANSYAAIVGNDWLRKTKAILDYNNNLMTIEWKDQVLEVITECREMPHHISSIEVPNIEAEDEVEEEVDEDAMEESEDEFESDDEEAQEQLFCNAKFITRERAQEIEEELKEGNFVSNEYYYQYEEIEKGKFHTGKLNEEQLRKFENFMERYQNLFAWDPNDFGRTSIVTHKIDTGDATPIGQRFYRTSYQNQLFIKEEIQRLLDTGLIVPSKSQWTSPVVVVEKKNGKKRLCVDYRKLNNVTKRDCYPLPRVDDMLETLSGCQWFSSLDLASGFWQVELSPKDREKLTFITRFGTFEFTVMPFGLCNAPATFQRLMDTVLRDILWQFVVVYIDDINIGSKMFEEHLQHLEQVFLRLEQAGLKLSPEKCFFFKDEIPFLGHVVSRKGIQTDPEKLRVIKEFPVPKDLTQLRGFIALASYYRKFVKGFSSIAEPLNRLLKKNTPYIWK
ncbi:retroviral-like aspartic protease 1 [Rhizophagus clarus]|uniref:Retroviral-like aspartic protease 1 n=1 Tax=Rhizophagus clarus TaxID=94130 RepID=A0A8H3KQ56_9GLOM|nr:retroviral-like aspartic protease 1 [Rhizophagus clarus]